MDNNEFAKILGEFIHSLTNLNNIFGQLSASINNLTNNVNQLPKTDTIRSQISELENSILLKTELQHGRLASSAELNGLEESIKNILADLSAKTNHLYELSIKENANEDGTIAAFKAATQAEIERAKIQSQADIATKQIDSNTDVQTVQSNNSVKKSELSIKRIAGIAALITAIGTIIGTIVTAIAPHINIVLNHFFK